MSSAHDAWREVGARQAAINRRHPWRRVTGHRMLSGHYGCNTGAWSYLIQLECGHEGFRKGSQGVPRKMRCLECPPEAPDGDGGDQ